MAENTDLIKEKLDIVDFIRGYLKLDKAGRNFKGLCPFHEEKTPSFQVQSGDDHYHCFGCGAHGDAIAFIMKHLTMSFVEAVEYLSERVNVPLEKSSEGNGKKGPKNLLDSGRKC